MLFKDRWLVSLFTILIILSTIFLITYEYAFGHEIIFEDRYFDPSLRERMAQSERNWATNTQRRQQRISSFSNLNDREFFPAFRHGEANQDLDTIWDFFVPAYSCPWEVERIGGLGSGGKWVCGMSGYGRASSGNLILYSLGINNESSFEAEMLERTNCEVYGFDYTGDQFGPEIQQQHLSRTVYSRIQVGEKNDDSGPYPTRTLTTLMAQNNHTYIDILKVDIDGAEFPVMNRFMDDVGTKGVPIGQLLIEIHLFDRTGMNFPNFRTWWERLEGFGLRPLFQEMNYRRAVIGTPTAAEFTWLNTRVRTL